MGRVGHFGTIQVLRQANFDISALEKDHLMIFFSS